MSRIQIEPATAERWPDVVAVFGRSNCWCQRFIGPTDDPASALDRQIQEAEVPIGLLAYAEGVPVGWSRVMPRRELPGILQNRALKKLLDDDLDAWWVTCFVVVKSHRQAGVGTALLAGGIDWAKSHGATVLDGHPVDVESLAATQVSGSAVFTGTKPMFDRLGFHEIGRTYRSRPVMRVDFE